MDRGDWRATIDGVTKSWAQLSDLHTHTLDLSSCETLHL